MQTWACPKRWLKQALHQWVEQPRPMLFNSSAAQKQTEGQRWKLLEQSVERTFLETEVGIHMRTFAQARDRHPHQRCGDKWNKRARLELYTQCGCIVAPRSCQAKRNIPSTCSRPVSADASQGRTSTPGHRLHITSMEAQWS